MGVPDVPSATPCALPRADKILAGDSLLIAMDPITARESARTMPAHDAFEELEARAGITHLHILQARLDASRDEWSRLGALHGPGGKYDQLRKAMLDAIALRYRSACADAGTKVTESAITEYAHAADEYRVFLDRGVIDHARYLQIDAERDGIMTEINRGQALARFAAAERQGG